MKSSGNYFQWSTLTPLTHIWKKIKYLKAQSFQNFTMLPQNGSVVFPVQILYWDPGPLLRLLDINEIQTAREVAREEICIHKLLEAHNEHLTMLTIK